MRFRRYDNQTCKIWDEKNKEHRANSNYYSDIHAFKTSTNRTQKVMKKNIIFALVAISIFTTNQTYSQVKYPVKAATVTYSIEMLGMINSMTLYFDDFGKNQCTDAEMEIFGQKTHTRSIFKNNISYSVDMINQSYTKKEVTNEELMKSSNFFDDAKAEQEGLEKQGTENICGKKCQIYSQDKDGTQIKMWIWDKLMLKMETSAQGFTMNIEAKEIKEGTVNKNLFEVPKDFILTTNEEDLKID